MLLAITKVKQRQSRSTIKINYQDQLLRSTIKINYYQEHNACTTHVQNNKKSDKINFMQQNGVVLLSLQYGVVLLSL